MTSLIHVQQCGGQRPATGPWLTDVNTVDWHIILLVPQLTVRMLLHRFNKQSVLFVKEHLHDQTVGSRQCDSRLSSPLLSWLLYWSLLTICNVQQFSSNVSALGINSTSLENHKKLLNKRQNSPRFAAVLPKWWNDFQPKPIFILVFGPGTISETEIQSTSVTLYLQGKVKVPHSDFQPQICFFLSYG